MDEMWGVCTGRGGEAYERRGVEGWGEWGARGLRAMAVQWRDTETHGGGAGAEVQRTNGIGSGGGGEDGDGRRGGANGVVGGLESWNGNWGAGWGAVRGGRWNTNIAMHVAHARRACASRAGAASGGARVALVDLMMMEREVLAAAAHTALTTGAQRIAQAIAAAALARTPRIMRQAAAARGGARSRGAPSREKRAL
ncbi:vegetative cell wall protein gp1 [Gracilaria domingensis]|nr:vegetative cell wall protein gp1 [Gracilaria domingensis]